MEKKREEFVILKSVYLTNMVFAHCFSLNYFFINPIPTKRPTSTWIFYRKKSCAGFSIWYLCKWKSICSNTFPYSYETIP